MPFLKKKKKKENWETQEINGEEETPEEEEEEVVADKEEEKEETPEEEKLSVKKDRSWIKKEGELSIDVYETEENIVIQAPIAGIKKEEIEIVTEKDMIVIKGKRERGETEEIKEFFTKECFYGDFRREIILPEDTDPSRIEASMDEGVLLVKVPKIEREKKRKVNL